MLVRGVLGAEARILRAGGGELAGARGCKTHSIPFSLPDSLPTSDFRVNLALAYTELTEELGRLRELSSLQGRILRTLLQEQTRSCGEPVLC